MEWTPLLDGEIASAAAVAIEDIAREIAHTDSATAVDRTLFWAYATSFVAQSFAQDAYDRALGDVAAALEAGGVPATLHDGGLAGLGFALQHVVDAGGDGGDLAAALAAIDEALVAVVADDAPVASAQGRDPRRELGHDLTHGLAGHGIYFLERLIADPRAELAAEGLALVIRQLERTAIRCPHGASWRTTLDAMPASYRARYPRGYHDCGVAHGTPGVVAVLDRAAAVTGDRRARSLADDGVRWLVAQRQSPEAPGRFPTMVAAGETANDRARAAWCYGDPGIAAALWRAAPDLARETALDVARRDPEACRVRDAGLCHGAAGLGHLLHRCYRASGEPVFGDAARAWFARALAMRRSVRDAASIAGFAAWRSDGWFPSPGLLDGAIGVALALLAATTQVVPAWDRLLVCDLGGAGHDVEIAAV